MLTQEAIGMPRGRPRAFDTEKALDCALDVFWRKGYEGASLPDLTEAMGINRPSLYAAFGNKESLFRKALDRYVEGPAAYVAKALKQPTAREVAETLFYGGIELLTNPKNPRGCLAVQSALACGEAAATIRDELASRRKTLELSRATPFQTSADRRRLAAGGRPRCARQLHDGRDPRHGRAGRRRRDAQRPQARRRAGATGVARINAGRIAGRPRSLATATTGRAKIAGAKLPSR